MVRYVPLRNGIRTLKEVEREYILRALMTLEWNRSCTAKALGMSLRTLRMKLSQYRAEGYPIWHYELEIELLKNKGASAILAFAPNLAPSLEPTTTDARSDGNSLSTHPNFAQQGPDNLK